MTVTAVMRTGGVVTLAASLGATAETVLRGFKDGGSLTGSAVQWVETDRGDYVRVDQIERLCNGAPRT